MKIRLKTLPKADPIPAWMAEYETNAHEIASIREAIGPALERLEEIENRQTVLVNMIKQIIHSAPPGTRHPAYKTEYFRLKVIYPKASGKYDPLRLPDTWLPYVVKTVDTKAVEELAEANGWTKEFIRESAWQAGEPETPRVTLERNTSDVGTDSD